tara:strand:- start:2427 stop:2612 length:186 start_codon:yes stop_codon:yes gene_type:complete
MKDKWIRVQEVAKLFGVTRPTVYAWINQNKLPKPVNLGGIRWDRHKFQEWLQEEYGGVINA